MRNKRNNHAVWAFSLLKRGVQLTDEDRRLVDEECSFEPLFESHFSAEAAGLGDAEEMLKSYREHEIRFCSYLDDEYPPVLREIHQPPLLLFYRANRSLAEVQAHTTIAIVGSRNADPYGLSVSESIGKQLSDDRCCIVSGLALGIDGAAHRGALKGESDFCTLAVLGQGLLTKLYPAAHRTLADRIVSSGGAIVSHFLPETGPRGYNFLDRNRIIAGLSSGVLVIQAPQRSGSLSTARHALEQGRDVFVVPGPFDAARYQGSHKLIRQGATLVHDYRDLRDELPVGLKNKVEVQSEDLPGISRISVELYRLIRSSGTVSYKDLEKNAHLSGELDRALLELEIHGYIQRLPGNQIFATED